MARHSVGIGPASPRALPGHARRIGPPGGDEGAHEPAGPASDNPPLPDDSVTAGATALAALYHTQAVRLRRFFARRAAGEDVGDLVHDAFERLARRDADIAVERPERYLSRVAGNLLRDRAKFAARRAAALHVSIADADLVGADPHDALEARDAIARLEVAMQRLSPLTREVFLACRLDGHTHAEVAGLVGISVRSVRKRMGRAIAEIDRLLGQG